MKNIFPSLVLTCVTILIFADVASGQVTDAQRDRRRQFVGDLLKTLIESQMNRNPVQPQPGRPNLRPFPVNGPAPSQPLTPNMIQARQHFETWENESAQLVKMLRKEERRLPQVRPLLADALATHASVKAFRTNLGQTHTLVPLTDCFCDLDAQWRLLNHQLSQVRGLQPDCTACMARISDYDTRLCGLFEVQPQINRIELSRYCTQMVSSFQHLIQDVRYDMQGDPNYNVILGDLQRIYARLNEADRLINHGNYDSIVRIYNQCLTEWRQVKYKLVSCPHSRIQRDVHQIETIGAHMSELLWIQPEIDREYLCGVIGNMDQEVTAAFKNVSLHDLLQCKTPGVVLACCREFQNHCNTLSTRLRTDADVDALMWDYKQLSNQWQDLNGHLSAFTTPRVKRSVGQIDSGFQVLRGTFGDGPLIDRATLAGICSDLDQLSYRLIDVAEQHRRRGGYEKSFHKDFCGCSRNFHKSIHQMHEHVLADRRHDAHAKQDVAAAVAAWREVRPMINQCKPEHRVEMNQIRSRIEPLMVKLQVVFSD